MTGYVPALDGLRAVSIALVLLSHFGVRAAPGLLGVTIFFFISGLLITGQLLHEIERTGGIALPSFYIRRALRLYPALLVMVPVAAVLFSLVGGRIAGTDLAAALFYAVNLREVWHLLDSGLPDTPHPFGVLWSLAVEEHYYLVFPLLVLLLARRRDGFVAVLAGLIVATGLWRIHVAASCMGGCTAYRVEHGTDTRIDSILFGALLPALLASSWRTATLRLVSTPWAGTAGAALLLLSLIVRDPWFRTTLRFTLQGAGLFLVVGPLLYAPALARGRRWAGHPVLTLVGRWSYSLYLWHWVVLCLAIPLLPPALSAPLIEPGVPSPGWLATVCVPLLALSFGLATLSYYGVERPMLRLRRAFGSHAVGDTAVIASRSAKQSRRPAEPLVLDRRAAEEAARDDESRNRISGIMPAGRRG